MTEETRYTHPHGCPDDCKCVEKARQRIDAVATKLTVPKFGKAGDGDG